jgi:endonuclease/exonuclease/phosphatase family metal-dependent hydrolase
VPAAAAPTLAVITWNLHAGAGDLPRLVSDLVAGRLTRTPPVEYVLLLQEAVAGTRSDPAALAAARSLSLAYAPVRQNRRTTTGNAIVSTRPLSAIRTIALPRARQARSALLGTITLAGTDLFVVSAHFENRVSWWHLLFSDRARGRQAAALVAELPAGPGIVGGDLNTWLGTAEPAWALLAMRFPRAADRISVPTFRDRLVLDHLFFDLPHAWQVERRVLPETYRSDHHPVLAVVTAAS